MTCYKIHQNVVVQFASERNEFIPGLSQMEVNDWKSFPFLKKKHNTETLKFYRYSKRQRGQMVRAPDLKSGGQKLKFCSEPLKTISLNP